MIKVKVYGKVDNKYVLDNEIQDTLENCLKTIVYYSHIGKSKIVYKNTLVNSYDFTIFIPKEYSHALTDLKYEYYGITL